jgi:hypothetical protein
MQEHKITKEDGTDIQWTIATNNNPFCLLYNDNKQKFRFTPNENLNCELFMIGGGGAGGYFFGGGGGAGAAYINNNYTFKKNKTYTFEIGTGGMCDITDINKLFKSGLTLNIYNNTNTNLLNLNFTNNDYSSLGIQNSGMMQTFNVNNITIPSSIFHSNTTYIWDGYIKTNSTGYFNISINSKIKTIIWVDKYVFNNSNALIEGNNINDVKIIQLESNRFYNIKIIAYNDTNTSNNFNITFEGCQFFNFDKTEEKYIYENATDTVLTYRNDDNTFETIRCKGGGNGGCGYFNKNTNLDGGCGGGSGINKVKGTSIIGAIYNGYDGAVGDYCGGGGGIMSTGKNNIGGDGKIINWFNETLIFGAGGNAANLSETRNLGYGCGGNGGECCYYSKLLINNNGNNGCILIYVRSMGNSTPIIEGFSEKTKNMLPDDSISKKLIENSFKISKYINMATTAANRKNFFEQQKDDMAYINLVKNFPESSLILGGTNYKKYDTLINQTFIYDMLVISKLYAIVYRLYWDKFNNKLSGDTIKWANFCENAKLKLYDSTDNNPTKIESVYDVLIANLFNITNLNLSSRTQKNAYSTTLYTPIPTADNGSPGISTDIINNYNTKEGEKCIVPVYHNISNGNPLPYLSAFMNEEISKNAYYNITLSAIQSTVSVIGNISTITLPSAFTHDSSSWTSKGSTNINILDGNNFITRSNLATYYDNFENYVKTSPTNYDDYLYNRIAIYLETFNIILNTDSTIMLTTLKYYMHYYNLVVYNISIQYGLTKMQNERVIINTSTYDGCYTNTNGIDTASANSGSLKFRLTGTVTSLGADNTKDIYTATIENGIITSITADATPINTYSVAPNGVDFFNKSQSTTNLATFTYSTTSPFVTLTGGGSGYIPESCNSTLYATTLSAGSAPVPNTINTDLETLTNNLIYITNKLDVDSNNIKETTDNIYNTSVTNDNTSKIFYNNQLDLNKTINEYNGELENYNNISFYYKLVVAFAILLTIIILFIFGANSIDNNSKISVYVIIITMIIIAFILYKQYSGIKEGFTVILHRDKAAGYADIASTINSSNVNNYKIALEKYNNKLLLSLASSNINDNLGTSLKYINKLSVVKNEKAEIYNIKKMNLMNSIEILKKTVNFYYYIIIAIFFSIIILIIGLILYLLNPAMIIQIVILCIIPFIVLIYYVSYNIHKSTRLAENKNYWANYNPSSTTLSSL